MKSPAEMAPIVLDARYVRERPSGIGVMVDELVRRLPALMPEERFVFLRHPAARSPLSSAPNTKDVTIAHEANGPATLLAMPALTMLRGAKLYFAPFNILPWLVPCPAVVTVHDLMWLDSPELCRSPGPWGAVEAAFYRTGIETTLRSAATILTPSEATKAAITARSLRAGAVSHVVPHGVDDAFRVSPTAAPVDPEILARHVPGARRYVLAVGQAAAYKNHEGVVRAFGEAFPTDDGTHLVLVQRLGSASARLFDLARLLGIRNRIHVLPTVPFDDLVALYRGALCLCHPSFVEGWGMPVTEALASGCPVLTSDRSCLPEISGGAAELVDPTSVHAIARGLRALADEPDRREALRVLGFTRAAQLSWAKHAQATAEILSDLLAPRR
jgi:glycosyltransferase involved in cell wall biosynthesis